MAPFRSSGMSLANKCQVLFGLAVVLILTAALCVPWVRLQRVVDESHLEAARQLADAWWAGHLNIVPEAATSFEPGQGEAESDPTPEREIGDLRLRIAALPIAEAERLGAADAFLRDAITAFRAGPDDERAGQRRRTPRGAWEFTRAQRASGGLTRYRYARALHGDDLAALVYTNRPRLADGLDPADPTREPLMGLLLVDRESYAAGREVFVNRAFILLSGVVAGILAVAVFYVITTRIILSPVRVLRETAERVSKGDLYVRSDIRTGDEFEDLSETFNLMLANLKSSQDQLRQFNKSLDLKLNEIMASNVVLEQANRLKSEFLANVSHELRTPLNSILGFAEVIQGLDVGGEPSPQSEKRARYVNNILVSGRNLLDLINDLLDLAKIEAGRLEIYPETTNIYDVCEGLLALMRPQADKKNIALSLLASPTMPAIETDPGRFQQIVFNLLSNAVKFTPDGGSVTVSADRVWTREHGEQVQVSVRDTGPGIDAEHQKAIFEKFRQVDASHTRRHSGTGLGLAISRELATLLGGRLTLVSEVGRGSTFTLHLPLRLRAEAPQSLMPTPTPPTATGAASAATATTAAGSS